MKLIERAAQLSGIKINESKDEKIVVELDEAKKKKTCKCGMTVKDCKCKPAKKKLGESFNENESGKVSVNLDTAFEDKDVESFIQSKEGTGCFIKWLMSKYNVNVEVLEVHGPGGGWPDVLYTGTKENIIKMMKEAYDMDDEEIKYHLEETE